VRQTQILAICWPSATKGWRPLSSGQRTSKTTPVGVGVIAEPTRRVTVGVRPPDPWFCGTRTGGASVRARWHSERQRRCMERFGQFAI